MMTPILTRTYVEAHVTSARAEILRLGVQRLALFGSVQRNEARGDSDVDVLDEFATDQKTFDHLLALAELLEEKLGHRVELVTAESLSPYLRPYILNEAQDALCSA
jgi:predicted nucleotidyltransferase